MINKSRYFVLFHIIAILVEIFPTAEMNWDLNCVF